MKVLLITLFTFLSISAANAVDLAELSPCVPAAQRLCGNVDHSMSGLMTCGKILAKHPWFIDNQCKLVLAKYGLKK